MYTEINECIICKNELTQVLDLGVQYVVDFPKEKDESLLKAPLVLMRCINCSLIQLKHSVSSDRLYKKFWYRSGINEQMKDELLAVVENASNTVTLNKGDKVLDIGCNDGTLLGWYNSGVMTVGVDPCVDLVQEGMRANRMDIGISDFFSAEIVKKIYKATGLPGIPRFKIITAIAMFYDLSDPVKFLKDCQELLHPEGVLVIQMNYILAMLKDTAFDFISHEHRALYSVNTLNRAVEMAGLELQGIQLSKSNGGSIRAFVTHPNWSGFYASDIEGRLEMVKMMNLCQMSEIRMGLDSDIPYKIFANNVENKMEKLRKFLGALDMDGKKIYVYGASTRGTALLQYLFRDSMCMLKGVAERDENKYGRRMVGTWLPIMPESDVRSKADYMLVLPWHFRESILKRESEWINKSKGSFIFPLPHPQVVKAMVADETMVSSDTI